VGKIELTQLQFGLNRWQFAWHTKLATPLAGGQRNGNFYIFVVERK